MDLRRLRAGEWIAAASGVLLAVSLFLPWYTREAARPGSVPGREGSRSFSAWEVFSLVDVLLLVLGMLALGLLIVTAVQPTAAVGVAADALLTILAGVIAIVTVIRVLALPGSLQASDFDVARAPFAWIGLGAVLGVLGGTIVAMRDERLSKPGARTDATGVPVPAAPVIETFPAPQRGPADV